MDDLLSEFLTETAESLESLDVELVRLEQDPNDPELLSNIFRLVHTIKGTCGFLGLPRLESVAHAGENILGKFRDGELRVTPEAVSLILESLDAIKALLSALERTEAEPEGDDSDLIARLNAMANGAKAAAPAKPAAMPAEPAAAEAVAADDTPAEDDETEPENELPLIERVGGISAVDAAIELMYRKVLKDAELATLFDGVDMVLLQGRQVEFMAAVLGGPDACSGIELEAVQKRLVEQGLNAGHQERIAGCLRAALIELEVAEDAVADVLAVIGSTRDAVLGTGAQDEPDVAAPSAGDAKAESRGEQGGQKSVASQSVRITVDLLENLMTMVSELVLSRNQLLQILRRYEESEFAAPLQRLSLVTTDLQEGVMKTRMQPIGNAWSKLPRIVRDLGHELGKKIELEMYGAETELDRQVLEMIKDPLTHMVRNSADHGIEATPADRVKAGKPEIGRVTLNAYHEGGHIIIEICDDGRGINAEKVRAKALANGLATEAELDAMTEKQIQQFIFKAGFSTAEKVTNVSGRGVGMDVVRTNIERIGGHVELKSAQGKGSTFVVKIPLTLAIVSALIVECGGERFAIPQISVDELVRVSHNSEHRIESINDTPVLRLRNRLLPLVELNEMLKLGDGKGTETETEGGDETFIVVARVGTYSVGIVVDRVFESEEIVVKPVTPVLREISIFSGNTILGDGSVIMILDPNGIAQMTSETMSVEHAHAEERARASGDVRGDERTTMLVFRAGGDEPKAVPLALVARLEEIDRTTIEESNGQPVVQYRGQLMPLIAVDAGFKLEEEGRQHVVVFQDSDRSMGIMVDEIVDIVEDRLNVEIEAGRDGVLGTAVVAGRATEVIDTAYYLRRAFGEWFQKHPRASSDGGPATNRILLVDDSPFFRNLLTPLLSVAGYEVTAVKDGEAALGLREAGRDFDVIISDIEMPGMNGFDLARAIKQDGRWKDKPVLALSSYASRQDLAKGRSAGFDDYIVKLDREALLQSLSHSLSADRGAA